jgi:hypothetical protein
MLSSSRWRGCTLLDDGEFVRYKKFFPAEYSYNPWSSTTILYFGYHDGLVRTEEKNTPLANHWLGLMKTPNHKFSE